MKTYVLTVSRFFPATHKRKGEPTGFVEKILKGEKIHTIRANYELWKKRIEDVQNGYAVLSLRYWEGKPYRSKQVEFARLGKDDGVGIEQLSFNYGFFSCQRVNDECAYDFLSLPAANDGLSFEDWREWFRDYDLSKPMAIIHFTKFRYT